MLSRLAATLRGQHGAGIGGGIPVGSENENATVVLDDNCTVCFPSNCG